MSARPELLEQCRDHFAETLAAALGECGLRLPGMQATIKREAAAAFKELSGLRSKEDYQRLRSVTASRISLVHPEDMDLTVALINLSHALADACENELPRLHLLFMRLLAQDSSVLDQLPVGPEAVCIALRGVCDSGELPPELRLELPVIAEERLIEHLRQLYPALTRLLAEQGVEPASLLRSGQNAPGKLPLAGSLHETLPLPGHTGAGYQGPGQTASLQQGRSLDSPLSRLQARQLEHARPGGSQTPPASLDPALLAAIMERVCIWLTERQQAAAEQAHSPPLKLTELQTLLPAPSHAALEAIGLSLDVLVEDPRLCAPLRASLERLRLPLAKAALIDAHTLDDSANPVSPLLETLLRLAYALPADSGAEHPLCQRIEAVAVDIQRHFERDPALFGRHHAELAALESRLLETAQQQCAALLPQLALEAQREHSRSRAARAIRALCAGELPRPLRIFLERLWVRVLAAIHQHGGGEKSGAWLRALRSANQLIDSVQPRQDAAARQALLASLPALLAELRAGLDAIGTPEALRERAFQSFVQLHSAAIQGRPLESGPADDILAASPPRVEALAHAAHAFILRLAPEAEVERNGADWLAQLAPGDWLDLNVPGHGRKRLRLAACEGSPRLLLGCTLDAGFCLILPQRWLNQREADPLPLPTGPLFAQAASTALQRTPDYH